MKLIHHPLGTIHIPDQSDSLGGLDKLSSGKPRYWAADTETTGLDIYGPDYRVRLVQVGTREEAWLLDPRFPEHYSAIRKYTRRPGTWWHNFVFDALSLEEGGLELDAGEIMDAAQDTEILSRLLDPRGPEHGGIGHQLKALSLFYLGLSEVDKARGTLLKAARDAGIRDGAGHLVTMSTMWRWIPIDFEPYQFYAGQDVFLTARLAEELEPRVAARGLQHFQRFELVLARKCAEMQRIGTNFDKPYAENSLAEFQRIGELANNELSEYWGIEVPTGKSPANAKAQQIELFEGMGVHFTALTKKTEQPQLTQGILDGLATGDPLAEGGLASAILEAKHAEHYGNYLTSMLELSGRDGRIHPDIRPLRAATARMSISRPALQQLPVNDVAVRGAIVSDVGGLFVRADYAQMEFRVAAAISRDPIMRERILNGEDLHAATAAVIYGDDFSKEQRDICKRVGFGRLYRGQPKSLAALTGLPLPLVKKACRGFDKAYPATARWGDRVQAKVRAGDTTVITATGRPLICEAPWAAVNYSVQSPARDIFAQGILNLHTAGLGSYLRLVVHDEVVLSAPEAEAEEIARATEEIMSVTFKGIPIVTEAQILGKRWIK